MNISLKKHGGFDDFWLLILGIPFVAFLINMQLFGHLIQAGKLSIFSSCYFIALVYTTIYWLVFRSIYIFILIKYPSDKNNKKRWAATLVVILIAYTVLQFVLDLLLHPLFERLSESIEPTGILKVITSLTFSILILSIYEGLYLATQLTQSLVEKERLQQAHIESELSGLKQQINPHFLFNSLNTLSSLVYEDATRADAFICKLAGVYRYILDKNQDHKVLLKEEIDYVNAYIYMLKERFGSSIIIEMNIQDDAFKKYIIPLSLQITFENCMKHNVITKEKPLRIKLYTLPENEYIYISNNIQKLKALEEGTSVGLENIKRRLKFYTNASLTISESVEHFTVGIPLLDENKING